MVSHFCCKLFCLLSLLHKGVFILTFASVYNFYIFVKEIVCLFWAIFSFPFWLKLNLWVLVLCVSFFLKFSYFTTSHRRCSIKKGALKNLARFAGKHMCWGLFFNKVASLRPTTLLKKRLQHRGFPVNFAKFFGTSVLLKTSTRLLLPFIHRDVFRSQSNIKDNISRLTILVFRSQSNIKDNISR